MDLDQLRDPWVKAAGRPAAPTDADVAAIVEKAKGLDRAVRRRDRIELMAGVIAGGAFLWAGLETTRPWSRLGAALLVGCCVLIPLRLRLARRAPPDPTAAPIDALRTELGRVTAQRELLRTVTWWYLGPIYVGLGLFVAGGAPTWLGIVYLVVAGWFMLYLRRLNLAAARWLEARAAEIDDTIAALEAGG